MSETSEVLSNGTVHHEVGGASTVPAPKRRGRPPGSRNKPKVPPEQPAQAAADPVEDKASCGELTLQETCRELQALQRQRAIIIKSRNMQAQRLCAVVAGDIATNRPRKDNAPLVKGDWKKLYEEAAVLIKDVMAGSSRCRLDDVIRTSYIGIGSFEELKTQLERSMRKLARTLPTAGWAEDREQAGFGLLSLATVVGETGDLTTYAGPAAVWRRMGCAPWSFEGKTLMAGTWKGGQEGKLPAGEWAAYGYNPRRRSIAYIIGENIVKQNKDGPYRTKYLEAKRAAFHAHPDWPWKDCDKCVGEDLDPAGCTTCGGTGKKYLRANRHGMLVATKLLLKNLWRNWHGMPNAGSGNPPEADRSLYS